MRIIAGEYRGRLIKSPPDRKTRPTSDRMREAIFNILNPRIDPETRFLDLCSGTGAVGIEALSRGAGFATFIDISRIICGLIEENLDTLNIPEHQTEVFCSSAEKFLSKDIEDKWDIIYFDPPYSHDYSQVFLKIGDDDSKHLAAEGILLVEHHSKAIIPDRVGEIRRWRIVKQGETWVSFYEKK